jgi:predicted Zn-dependent protease
MVFLMAMLLLAPPTALPHRNKGPAFDQVSKQAGVARDANDLEAAIALYQHAVTLKPSWAEGWYYIATIQYDRDRFPEARDAFRKLLPLTPKEGASWALLGMCEFRTKEYELALKHVGHGLQLGVRNSPQLDQVATYHFAMLLTHFGQYEEAVQQLVRIARLGVDDQQAVVVTGLASLRRPLFPSEVKPADAALVLAAGRAVFDALARKPAESQKEMEALVAAYPATPNVHYVYGSFLMLSDPEAGVRELKRELEISPDHVPSMEAIALDMLKNGDAAGAMPYARKAVALEPDSFVTHNVYGRALVDSGELKPGITELELSRKLAPDSPQTRIALATAYAKDGRKEDAARERAEFLKLKAAVEPAPPQ